MISVNPRQGDIVKWERQKGNSLYAIIRGFVADPSSLFRAEDLASKRPFNIRPKDILAVWELQDPHALIDCEERLTEVETFRAEAERLQGVLERSRGKMYEFVETVAEGTLLAAEGEDWDHAVQRVAQGLLKWMKGDQ